MAIAAPPAPHRLTIPAPTPSLHRGVDTPGASRGLAAGRIGRHIASELQRGRPLHEVLDDRDVLSHLEPDGRAVAVEPL
jgi:hypothetical protein